MCHVLVIEDDECSASGVANLFGDIGAPPVDIIVSPQEASASAAQRRAALILSDFTMFDDTGLIAGKAIREDHGSDTPIIFITRDPDAYAALRGAAPLAKPVTRRQIVDAVLAIGARRMTNVTCVGSPPDRPMSGNEDAWARP